MSTIKGRIHQALINEVESDLLSNYMNDYVDFLKMDIEGSEKLAIEELSEKDKLKLINEIIIEYHHHINDGEDNFSEILKIIEGNGFGYQIISYNRDTFKLKGGF